MTFSPERGERSLYVNNLEDGIARYELVFNLGIAGVAAHWGIKREEQQITANGFPRLYQSPFEASIQNKEAEAIRVATRVIDKTLALKEWSRQDVSALFLGSGTPITPNFGWTLAQVAGLTHLNPETDVFNYYMACNSGARALQRALEAKRGNTLVVAHDRVASIAHSKEQVDNLSFNIFSNGAAALAFNDQSLRLVKGSELILEPDSGSALAAIGADEQWFERPEGAIYGRYGNTEVVFPPPPPAGKIIDMKGMGTTILFARALKKHLPPFVKEYEEVYPDQAIDLWMGHQPAEGVVELANKQTGIFIPWLGLEGNSSGATTLIAFVRLLQSMKKGRVGIVSYGAGASLTFLIVDVGEAGAI